MKIDTEIWTTQQALATKLNVSRQVVKNWVGRGKIVILKVPEWNMTFVNAKYTPNEKQDQSTVLAD